MYVCERECVVHACVFVCVCVCLLLIVIMVKMHVCACVWADGRFHVLHVIRFLPRGRRCALQVLPLLRWAASPFLRLLLTVDTAGPYNMPMGYVPLSTGRLLLAAAQTGASGYVSFSPAPLTSSNYDDIAAFSSFGPTQDGRIKPDIVAPGELRHLSE